MPLLKHHTARDMARRWGGCTAVHTRGVGQPCLARLFNFQFSIVAATPPPLAFSFTSLLTIVRLTARQSGNPEWVGACAFCYVLGVCPLFIAAELLLLTLLILRVRSHLLSTLHTHTHARARANTDTNMSKAGPDSPAVAGKSREQIRWLIRDGSAANVH
jgi:hypothetical protein